jgi:hypothetical protein
MRFTARIDDPAHPNQAFVDFPSGYIEINGSRTERERIALLIEKALNDAESGNSGGNTE